MTEPSCAAPQGNDIDQWFATQDHASRVNARLAFQPFKTLAVSTNLAHSGSVVIHLPKLRGLAIALVLGVEDSGQWNVFAHDGWGHCLGDAIPECIRKPQNPR